MLASAAAMNGPAMAAATISQYGSVKLQWNVAPVLTAAVHTDYTAAFANSGAYPTLLGQPAAANCQGGGVSTDLTVDFGTITPVLGGTAACTYPNAVGASVQTNDNNGFSVYEYLDAAPAAGINICAFPNTGAAFPMTPGAAISTTTRTQATTPAVYAGACAAGGSAITNPGAGVLTNAGAAPAQPAAPGTYTGEYLTGVATGTGLKMMSQATAAGSAVLAGEDLQINVGAAATSGNANVVMTLMFVSN